MAAYRQNMSTILRRILYMHESANTDQAFETIVNNMLSLWVANEIEHWPNRLPATLRQIQEIALEQGVDIKSLLSD